MNEKTDERTTKTRAMIKEKKKRPAAVMVAGSATGADGGRKIPYNGYVRIGDFKIWKSRIQLSVNDVSTPEERAEAGRKGKKIRLTQKFVEVIVVSDMQGLWSVKIPQTYLAYPMIEQCYADGNDEFLHTFLANINFVSAISNGFYQRGVALCGHCYMHPDILREGYKPENGPGHDDLMAEAKKVRDEFLHWYEVAKEQERGRQATAD